MPEEIHHRASQEQARNDAIRWLEGHGVLMHTFNHRKTGRLKSSELLGLRTGLELQGQQGDNWVFRVDWDPAKGAHFNVEVGKGPNRPKAAFCFPGSEQTVIQIARLYSR
jgi:hypothetical protein